MDTQGLILVVSGLIVAAGLLPVLRDLRRDLMCVRNAVVLLYLLHFGIWPFVMVLGGQPRFLRPLDSWADHLLTASLYALAGLVMFQLGHQSRLAEVLSRRLPSPAPLWNWRAAKLVWLCLILVSSASFQYLMADMGGPRAYLADLGTNRTQGLVARWYFVWGATLFVGVGLVLAYAMWVKNRSLSNSVRLGLTALLLSAFGFTIGYRSNVALPLLQIVIWHHYAVKRIRIGLRFTVLALGAAWALVVYSEWREVGTDAKRLAERVQATDFYTRLPRLAVQRFYGAEALTAVLSKVPHDEPLRYGVDSGREVLTAAIPRALWPDKDTPIGFRFSNTFFTDYVRWGAGGVLSTLPGEAFWNFHVLGVVVSGFLFGVFCRLGYLYFMQHPSLSSLWIYCFGFTLSLRFLESPTHALIILLSNGIPTVLVLFLITRGAQAAAFWRQPWQRYPAPARATLHT